MNLEPFSAMPWGVVNRWAHGLSSALTGRCLQILIFHRVLRAPDPIFPGEMHAERFEQLLKVLKRAFDVMTLGDAVRALIDGTLPPRALVLTFDDGYADNAEVALPILRKHGLVATFFVSTGFLDGGRMWNDSVIEAVRAARIDQVDLSFLGLPLLSLDGLGARCSAIARILPVVKYMNLDNRRAAVDRVVAALGSPALPSDLMMRASQVRELSHAGMEIGAHTVNHPILAEVNLALARREIVDGRERLQEIIDRPIEVLAYPNGMPNKDFRDEHVLLARSLGFIAAVTTAPGVARSGADLHQLPRFTPWDATLGRWSARLWLNRFQSTPVR